jgi:hypothetical protein
MNASMNANISGEEDENKDIMFRSPVGERERKRERRRDD